MNLNYRKICSMGPGGYHCRCCGPLPKERPVYRRRVRKIFSRLLDKILKDE